MTLKFSAKITVHDNDNTKAIFDSINTDNDFYPENPTRTVMSLDKKDDGNNEYITINLDSEQLPHLRANLNSTLRLIQACHDTLESTKACNAN